MGKKIIFALSLIALFCAVFLTLPIPKTAYETSLMMEFRYYNEAGDHIRTEYSGGITPSVLVTRIIGGYEMSGRLYLTEVSKKNAGTLKGTDSVDGWGYLEVLLSVGTYKGYLA